MNRNYAYAALGVAIVIVGIAIYAGMSSTSTDNASSVIAVATSTIAASTTAYRIEADYPVFGIKALDSQIVDAVNLGVADIEGMPANPSPNGIQNEFVSAFDSVYSDPSIASVRLILSEYTGGAHDISVATGFVYNRATGTFLTLGDALALTGDTLDQVAVLAKSQLIKKYGSVAFPDGLDATSTNYSAFTVDKTDVIFTLQEYQAQPYSDGMPQIVVPRIQ